jgi:hypothetical protein
MKDRGVGKDNRKVPANGVHSHDGGHTWHHGHVSTSGYYSRLSSFQSHNTD